VVISMGKFGPHKLLPRPGKLFTEPSIEKIRGGLFGAPPSLVLRRAIFTLLDLASHVLAAATSLKAQVSALVGFRHPQFSPLTGEFGNTRLVT